MLDSLLDTIGQTYDASRQMDLIKGMWEQEVWFDTPHQAQAAELARQYLAGGKRAKGKAANALDDVRLVPFAADGKTKFEDWTTHFAWDCPAAKLSLGDHVLGDRQKCPLTTVMASGPLAPTQAGVIDGDAIANLTAADVRGKFVLTKQMPIRMKHRLLGLGAVALVSDFAATASACTEDTVKWNNAWGDRADGWYHNVRDERMPGFVISPRQGKLLRAAMAKGPVKLTGSCDSRLYKGEQLSLTGRLAGTDPSREVWLVGHAYEQGAMDNCSGVSIYLEALRLLGELVRAGKLPRPRRSIRVVMTEECLGEVAFVDQHPDLARSALAAMNVDDAGDSSKADGSFRLHYGCLSMPGVSWAMAGAIIDRMTARTGGTYRVHSVLDCPSGDHMMADPMIGVPSQWIGAPGGSRGYHSSADTPAIADPEAIRRNTLVTAAWAYAMANLDDASMRAMLPGMRQWIDANLLPAATDDGRALRRWAAGRAIRDAYRFGVSADVIEPAAREFAAPDAAPLPNLPVAGPRIIRQAWGTYTFDGLPAERGNKFSRWSSWQYAAISWCSANLPVDAVARLAEAETGEPAAGRLMNLFQACADAGLARWA